MSCSVFQWQLSLFNFDDKSVQTRDKVTWHVRGGVELGELHVSHLGNHLMVTVRDRYRTPRITQTNIHPHTTNNKDATSVHMPALEFIVLLGWLKCEQILDDRTACWPATKELVVDWVVPVSSCRQSSKICANVIFFFNKDPLTFPAPPPAVC